MFDKHDLKCTLKKKEKVNKEALVGPDLEEKKAFMGEIMEYDFECEMVL